MTGVKTFSLSAAEPIAGIYIALSPQCFGSAWVSCGADNLISGLNSSLAPNKKQKLVLFIASVRLYVTERLHVP